MRSSLTTSQALRLRQLDELYTATLAYERSLQAQIEEVARRREKIEAERVRLQDIDMGRQVA